MLVCGRTSLFLLAAALQCVEPYSTTSLAKGTLNARCTKSELLVTSTAIRGGSEKKTPSKEKKENAIMNSLNKIQPATRLYILFTAFCTAIHLSGLPAPEYFGVNIRKPFQFWRPFTSMAYFGTPKEEDGAASHLWFMIVESMLLTALGVAFGFPFLSKSFVTAMVYYSTRRHAMDSVPFQFGLTIQSWQLPFCMMGIDCLSKQSMSAAWPHALGIVAGHIYVFFNEVWPSVLGRPSLIKPPIWFLKGIDLIPYFDDSLRSPYGSQGTKGLYSSYRKKGFIQRLQGSLKSARSSKGRKLSS